MKKIIITMMITVCVMAAAGFGIISKMNQDYVDKYEALESSYDELVIENEELTNDLNDLSNNVYNMKNGKAYEIHIKHDGEYHTWMSKNEGLFDSELHSVIY